jgi:hypothetical protein
MASVKIDARRIAFPVKNVFSGMGCGDVSCLQYLLTMDPPLALLNLKVMAWFVVSRNRSLEERLCSGGLDVNLLALIVQW